MPPRKDYYLSVQIYIQMAFYHAIMNKEIEKFYLDGIDSEDFTEDFIREALVTGIRCDNPELVRKATGNMHFAGAFYGYSSPMEFAVKDKASVEVLRVLQSAGYSRQKHFDLNPFNGSPESICELIEEYAKRKDGLAEFVADIDYFFNVIKTDYSCYRIPYDVDVEDRYKPCFWNYLDGWLSRFIKLLAESKARKHVDSHFAKTIIANVELKESFDTIFTLFSAAFKDTDIVSQLNVAVSNDNEHAFYKILQRRPNLIQKVTCYPASNKKILSTILDAGILRPGTNKGFNAYISFISAEGETNKDILNTIVHSSYSTRTVKKGVTPLMYAVKNKDFPVELYRLLITYPDDVNIQDEDGQTALHYMAKTDYPECIESLLELGADPFITDNKGNNVLHTLAGNKEMLSIEILGDCVSLLPKKLLTMENCQGVTPVDLFFQKLTGSENLTCRKLSFNQFLNQYLASPDSLKGHILIGGADNETRFKLLSMVRQHIIKRLRVRKTIFGVIAERSEKTIVRHLEMLVDGILGTELQPNGKPRFYLIIINEIGDCQSEELSEQFETSLKRLSDKDNVLIVAATRLSSDDVITDAVKQAFPYRITALHSSDISSEVFLGIDDAAYISKDEVLIKGFEDSLLLSNLESEEKPSEKKDEDSIVIAQAERILNKHLAAFKELAK